MRREQEDEKRKEKKEKEGKKTKRDEKRGQQMQYVPFEGTKTVLRTSAP